jgi:hypothetical protein
VLQLQRTIGNEAVGQLMSEIGMVPSYPAQQEPVQRQVPEEEELLQGKMMDTVQRQVPEEEELLQGKMMDTEQRQVPEEEELLQGKMMDTVQRQVPEEEELLQGKIIDTVQRQVLEEEELLQGKMMDTVQRQVPEEEELLQGKMMETVQRQVPEEEELLQGKMMETAPRLLNSMSLQAKLTVNPPNDIYEQEADRVAEAVTGALASQAQRQEEIQAQSAEGQPDTVSESIEARINNARGGGHPLSDNVREPMEQAFGADFSEVRIHNDSEANLLNQQLSAKAFTTARDIFFRQGEYSPGSGGGKKLIAHELTHVVQQNGYGSQLASRTIMQRGNTIAARIKSSTYIPSTTLPQVINRLTFDGKEIDIDTLSYTEAHDYLTKIHEKDRGEEAGEKTWQNLEYSTYDYAMLRKKVRLLEKQEKTVLCSEGESKFVQPGQKVDFGGVSSCMTITLTLDNNWKIVAHDGLRARCGLGSAVKELQDRLKIVFPDKQVTKIRAYGAAGSWTYELKTPDEEGDNFKAKRLNHEGNEPKFIDNLRRWFRGSKADIEFTSIEGQVIVSTSGELFGKDIQEAVSDFIGSQDAPWKLGGVSFDGLVKHLKTLEKFSKDPQIGNKLLYLLNTVQPGLKSFVSDIP